MIEQRVERRLTAIFAGDVAGYSRLMGADEEGTLSRLNSHRREFLEPKIAEHRGRIVKRTGDGILIEFGSAVDAARCAIEIQRGMVERNASIPQDKRIQLRIGIHVGDIIIEESDIFGDGVNIAARLESIAQPDGIGISVNLSPAQFNQGDLAEVVARALTASRLSPQRLMLEITESILLENTNEVLTILARLRELEVRIAMDDFGIGFSSLSSLSKFPFSKIKIDKSFIAGLGQSEHSAAIIEAVATLGARLDIITTAEGVETADQLAWLRAIGISEVQGYLIGRPQPAGEVTKMIAAAAKRIQSAA